MNVKIEELIELFCQSTYVIEKSVYFIEAEKDYSGHKRYWNYEGW